MTNTNINQTIQEPAHTPTKDHLRHKLREMSSLDFHNLYESCMKDDTNIAIMDDLPYIQEEYEYRKKMLQAKRQQIKDGKNMQPELFDKETITQAVKSAEKLKPSTSEAVIQRKIKQELFAGQKIGDCTILEVNAADNNCGFSLVVKQGDSIYDVGQSKFQEFIGKIRIPDEYDRAKTTNKNSNEIKLLYKPGDVVNGWILLCGKKSNKGARKGFKYKCVPENDPNAKPIWKKQSFFSGKPTRNIYVTSTPPAKTIKDFADDTAETQPVYTPTSSTKVVSPQPVVASKDISQYEETSVDTNINAEVEKRLNSMTLGQRLFPSLFPVNKM